MLMFMDKIETIFLLQQAKVKKAEKVGKRDLLDNDLLDELNKMNKWAMNGNKGNYRNEESSVLNI